MVRSAGMARMTPSELAAFNAGLRHAAELAPERARMREAAMDTEG